MFKEYADIVSVQELCEMLGIGKNTAYRLLKQNAIYSLRIGKKIKIPKKSVIEFCEKDSLSDRDCDTMAAQWR